MSDWCFCRYLQVGSLSVSHDGIGVFQRPFNECVDVREQGVGAWRECIFHPWRNFGVHGACNVAVVFQRAQGHGKHLLRYVGDFALQFFEPGGFFAGFVQCVYYQ